MATVFMKGNLAIFINIFSYTILPLNSLLMGNVPLFKDIFVEALLHNQGNLEVIQCLQAIDKMAQTSVSSAFPNSKLNTIYEQN